jgi:hypothetical protein
MSYNRNSDEVFGKDLTTALRAQRPVEPVVSALGVTSDGAFFVKWEKFDDDNFPRIGEKVILKLRGVVQHETYELDQGDDGFGCGEHFWTRDGLDDCPAISDSDEWIALSDLGAH